ncbi:MAG: phosphoribosylanthranilate isomerase [Oscillospiraceae bacterium]|nr:phosphoribosylanthranilate isomerase [Oscillospiraceae bacterium]
MPKIKICGLSRAADIEYVNSEKPDYIGFVFAESRRKVTFEQALKLREKLNPDMIPVGVFVNEAIENILQFTKSGVIDMVQLHGAEDEEYIRKLKSLSGVAVIKAVPIQNKGDAQSFDNTAADYLLLDNKSGGTGQSFDWDLIGELKKPFFLAGGLTVDNAAHAAAKVKPFALDVSSGVETNGVKDFEKIREFIGRVLI